MGAYASEPVHFAYDSLEGVFHRLAVHGVEMKTLRTSKSTPRLIVKRQCRFRDQKFRLLGFQKAGSTSVALQVWGRLKQAELLFELQDVLLSFGGSLEGDYGRKKVS